MSDNSVWEPATRKLSYNIATGEYTGVCSQLNGGKYIIGLTNCGNMAKTVVEHDMQLYTDMAMTVPP